MPDFNPLNPPYQGDLECLNPLNPPYQGDFKKQLKALYGRACAICLFLSGWFRYFANYRLFP